MIQRIASEEKSQHGTYRFSLNTSGMNEMAHRM